VSELEYQSRALATNLLRSLSITKPSLSRALLELFLPRSRKSNTPVIWSYDTFLSRSCGTHFSVKCRLELVPPTAELAFLSLRRREERPDAFFPRSFRKRPADVNVLLVLDSVSLPVAFDVNFKCMAVYALLLISSAHARGFAKA